MADFDQAIKIKPDLAEAYCGRGTVHENRGELDKALADFDHAIKLKPDFAEAHWNRGNVHEKLGRKDAAVADYRKAQELGLSPALQKEAEKHLQELQAK